MLLCAVIATLVICPSLPQVSHGDEPAEQAQPKAEQPPELPDDSKPGETPAEPAPEKPAETAPSTMRQLLKTYCEIFPAELDTIKDGTDISLEERETFLQILGKIRQIPPRFSEPLLRTKPNWAEIVQSPQDARGQFYEFTGRAKYLRRFKLPIKEAERVGFDAYTEVTIDLDNGNTAAVYLRAGRGSRNLDVLPEDWADLETIDEPVSVRGIFIKTGPKSKDGVPMVFVAARIGWFPDKLNEALHIDESMLFLARHGMDIGLFDYARQRNAKSWDRIERAGLGDIDLECFYTLLKTVSSIPEAELEAEAKDKFILGSILTEASKYHGHSMTMDGTAVRIDKHRLDSDNAARFGFDHYFEVFVRLRIPNSVRLRYGEEDEKGIVYNDYPMVFCVRQLPDGWTEMKEMSLEVRVTGVFFRNWGYETTHTKLHKDGALQVSPMFVGREMKIKKISGGSLPSLGVMLAIFLPLLTLGGGFIVWSAYRTQRRKKLRSSIQVPKLELAPATIPIRPDFEADRSPSSADDELPDSEPASKRHDPLPKKTLLGGRHELN